MKETDLHLIFLREWRDHLNLTQDDLANKMGTTKGTISRYENSKRGIRDEVIRKIADAMGVDPIVLFRVPAERDKAEVIDRFIKFIDESGVDRAKALLDAIAPKK